MSRGYKSDKEGIENAKDELGKLKAKSIHGLKEKLQHTIDVRKAQQKLLQIVNDEHKKRFGLVS